MSRYSARVYEQVAEIIRTTRGEEPHWRYDEATWALDAVAEKFADLFAADNERFDRGRFIEATEIGPGTHPETCDRGRPHPTCCGPGDDSHGASHHVTCPTVVLP